ncbi:MAG: hypothetical protein K2P58_06500 [Hyphomonadaceae bacterium]|nr:hypothetical protein [Hyphomonadaceae bacterium]
MRLVAAILGALAVAQCAASEDQRFRVGQSPDALVIVGVAETEDHRDPRYSLLWRRLGPDGRFEDYDDARSIDARTHSSTSLRLDGIPGEFEVLRVSPGTYALDSAYATLRENAVSYVAHGLVVGPERPAFAVGPGEAVYLGIWEMDIEGAQATARLWRLSEQDLRAVTGMARDRLSGAPRMIETEVRTVACEPRRMTRLAQRQVC